MSEGRTPTATLTQQRQLEQEDVDILNQIVIRAQNDPNGSDKDALFQAFREISNEKRLNQHQDRACLNVLLKLLDPATLGESLYHKWENILHDEGIVMTYDDDATTQDASPMRPIRALDYEHSDGQPQSSRPPSAISQQAPKRRSYSIDTHPLVKATADFHDEDYLDNPPPHIARLMLDAQKRDHTVLCRQTLDALKSAYEVSRSQRLEARADALYEMRLKQKTLKQCLAVFEDVHSAQVQADEIYRSTLVRNALGKTKDEYRVHRVESIDDDRIKGLSLYKWALASREANFVNRREWGLKRSFIRKMINSYRASKARQAELENLLQRRRNIAQGVMLRSAMSFLTQRTSATRQNHGQAELRDRGALYKASIDVWRTRSEKLIQLNLTAEEAREYLLMKRVLRRLQSVTMFRKDRRNWLAKWSMRKWQEFVRSRKHNRYDECYRQMRRLIKMNLARKMLSRWQQVVQIHREQDAQANACYHDIVMRRTVKPAVEKMWDTADLVERNDALASAKADQFLGRRAIIAIQMKQQTLLDMADNADRLHQYRTEQRAVQGLRQMQFKAFELRRRLYDAEAFRDRHDKRNIRNAVARLRRALVERRSGDEGPFTLLPAPAATPARKREELLLRSSTRLSTTPAYTPFAARLRQEPRILEDIEDMEEDLEDTHDDIAEIESEP